MTNDTSTGDTGRIRIERRDIIREMSLLDRGITFECAEEKP